MNNKLNMKEKITPNNLEEPAIILDEPNINFSSSSNSGNNDTKNFYDNQTSSSNTSQDIINKEKELEFLEQNIIQILIEIENYEKKGEKPPISLLSKLAQSYGQVLVSIGSEDIVSQTTNDYEHILSTVKEIQKNSSANNEKEKEKEKISIGVDNQILEASKRSNELVKSKKSFRDELRKKYKRPNISSSNLHITNNNMTSSSNLHITFKNNITSSSNIPRVSGIPISMTDSEYIDLVNMCKMMNLKKEFINEYSNKFGNSTIFKLLTNMGVPNNVLRDLKLDLLTNNSTHKIPKNSINIDYSCISPVSNQLPTTNIRISLLNSQKLILTLNYSHTIGDIKKLINSAIDDSVQSLTLSYPPFKVLSDNNATISEENIADSLLRQTT